ncbi:MAG: hypothetical protein AAGJ31_11370 [Verrucomicrobiota bacterium]
MKKHEWREQTGESTTYYRATHHAGKWDLKVRPGDEEAWTSLDPIPKADLERLHDVLQRKYQRRRVPFQHVEQVARLLEMAPDNPTPEREEGSEPVESKD